jgi:molybdopterin-guanine dinucleotide biosynthesis protein
MKVMRPKVVAVSGFSSNTGKTTLMCELLRALPGWEAIKLTRGHYRSCGKDPHTCCVSDLLGAEPSVRSGREGNYEAGKDTGRYWDAGAANVHWVIATDEQVEPGIQEALSRVRSPGVLIEGNSFLDYVAADFALVCARAEGGTIKTSARKALHKASGIYVSTISDDDQTARAKFASWCKELAVDLEPHGLPVYTRDDLPRLIELMQLPHAVQELPNACSQEGQRSVTQTVSLRER